MRRLIYVCSALDDQTRIRRGISSDSPAASRKVFATCVALRKVGVRPVIVSMGRGRADSSWRYFPTEFRRIQGVPVVYMPFTHIRILSEILSMVALAFCIFKMHKRKGNKICLFYNRTIAYIPPLWVATLLRLKRVLDLEDGDIRPARWTLSWGVTYAKIRLYKRLCSSGTLLVCSALGDENATEPRLCFYGASSIKPKKRNWSGPTTNILLGGTVSVYTGAELLERVIARLRLEKPAWAERLHFFITGKGDHVDPFHRFTDSPQFPRVTVFGRLNDEEYNSLLDQSHVGLALKPNTGILANTTFPSKVVEMAGAGLLVVTTNISDVAKVLGGGAVYLDDDESSTLMEALRLIAENPQQAELMAQLGVRQILRQCDIEQAGHILSKFLFDQAD